MKYLLLGAGRQGTAIAQDLLQTAEGTTRITVADTAAASLQRLEERLDDGRLTTVEADVRNEKALGPLMADADVAVSAVNSWLHFPLASLAVQNQTHFLDLGSKQDLVAREFELDEAARQASVTVIPGCGLAPGLSDILGCMLVESLGKTESLKIRVGGLPTIPRPPMNYQVVSPIPELIQRYVDPAVVIRNGMLQTVPALSELETLKFPEPFGELEAFQTSGGLSTLPQTLAGRVPHLDFKTIQYKGHGDHFRFLNELGLMDAAQLEFPGGRVGPREMLTYTMEKALDHSAEDVVLFLAVAEGWDAAGQAVRNSLRIIDRRDPVHDISAMMRMSGYPAAIIARMLAAGQMESAGVCSVERAVTGNSMIPELERRGVQVEQWSDLPGEPA